MSDMFGGVLAGIGSVVNAATQEDINRQNIAFQQDTNARNEALMRESWAREDNAVQRRAADLQAAGMNPLLAAGGAASSSAPVRLSAPDAGVNPGFGNVASNAIAGALDMQRLAQTQSQTELTQANARKANAEADVAEQTVGYDISAKQSQAQYLADSLADRLKETKFKSTEAGWKMMSSSVEAMSAAAASGQRSFVLNGQTIEVPQDMVNVGKLKIALIQRGVDLKDAEIASMAAAVVKSQKSAEFWKNLGLSPEQYEWAHELVRGAIGVVGAGASTAARAYGASIPF